MNETRRGRLSETFALLSEEPFRLFFPLGSVLALVGVSLWVLFYLGANIPYPAISHARLMIEGFMGSFIFGFLGTAGPRIASARHFAPFELGIVFTLEIFSAGAHLGEAHRLGDFCFAIGLLAFFSMLLKRFRQGEDLPPPNFALVALGLACGIVGAGAVAFCAEAQYSFGYQFGAALLNQCFVLLPILGVAPFFIRRLLDSPAPDVSPTASEWKRRALATSGIGLLIVGSYFVDIRFNFGAGAWLRAALVLAYLAQVIPFQGRSFLAGWLRAALAGITLGLTGVALLPGYRVAMLHLVFITGFNLVAFTVATRVVLGHSGNLPGTRQRLWFLIISGTLLFVAMIARVTADLAPQARTMHLLSAAICWLLGALIWIGSVIPKVRLVEPE